MLVHSPFVFRLYNEVYKGKRSAWGAEVAALRKRLTQDPTPLSRQDFGAGGEDLILLGQTARQAGRRRIEGEWLYRLCRLYQPRALLELGTHLGLSALYQSGGLEPGYQFLSLEGDPQLAAMARQHLAERSFPVQVLEGEFSEVLQGEALQKYRPDYALIDGNHRLDATLAYFETLLPRMQDGGIMVFDDIQWSAEMAKAWQIIIQHPEVSVSIDLFTLGICFIRRPQAKEHFQFRYRLLG